VAALRDRALDRFAAVHLVHNNAGIGLGGPIWEVSEQDWRWILGVNLWGVIHGVRAFVPKLVAQGEGHVVNTASIAGLVSAPGMGAYCATKHAVVAMSECLHHDLAGRAPGKVNVSVLCPAWVKTRITDSDRNRPASAPRSEAGAPSPEDKMIEGMVRAAVEAGIPAEVVAEKVLKAIVEEKFWILTHTNTKPMVEKRMTGIVEGRSPEFVAPR
jgi:NAD(P)-dependent dehydrogenase (short-subunit alcohol dehydrogenase family)